MTAVGVSWVKLQADALSFHHPLCKGSRLFAEVFNRFLWVLGLGSINPNEADPLAILLRPRSLAGARTRHSRPIMIDDLAALIRDGFSCPSKETIEEMMSFVVKADGKAEADQSCFDDRIIASAIAVQVHKNFGISRYFPSAR